jgi:RNA polymerase sigma-70 factor, ECF subfamily
MTDEQRLSAALANDLDGHFEQFVRIFQDRMYGFALRLLASPPDAEEVLQDAFVRAYRALQRYPAERRQALQLRPWLYRIVLNAVRNRVRRPALATVPVDGPVGNGLAVTRSIEQPELALLDAERRSRLATALAELPPRYARAVTLRHVQGLSYSEVAEILEQPIGTTKSDVHRGLQLLRSAVDPELRLASMKGY